jgi:molecular chaperone DnaK (HSP70)
LGIGPDATFNYTYTGIEICEKIENNAFNNSITQTVEEIMSSMMEVFKQSGLNEHDVDQVCLTGGSSQVFLIREKLKNIFGEHKLVDSDVYQSVVNGLAKYASRL